jgi:hypothetical protein
MGKKRVNPDIDELLFHDELPEEEYSEEYDFFEEDDPDKEREPDDEEEEDDLLQELEIGKNGHIVKRHRRGHGEEEDSPITIDWDE